MAEEKVSDLAEELGKAMAASERVRNWKKLNSEVAADKEAQRLVRELNEHEMLLARKQHAGQPIEVNDKHKLRDLQNQTYSHPKLQAMMKAYADYAELVQDVNDILSKHISVQRPQSQGPAQAGQPQGPVQ